MQEWAFIPHGMPGGRMRVRPIAYPADDHSPPFGVDGRIRYAPTDAGFWI